MTVNFLLSYTNLEFSKKTLLFIFIVLAVLTTGNIFFNRELPTKSGLYTILRVALETGVLIYLYIMIGKAISDAKNYTQEAKDA